MGRSNTTLIIGAGIAGLATAYHLAREGGASVTVLEREPDVGLQSSAKSAAILRTAVPEPAVRALTAESAGFLTDPPADFPGAKQGPLVDGRGLVLTSNAADDAELVRLAEASPAPKEALDAEAVARLCPEVRLPAPESVRGYLFPTEGRIDVERLVHGLARGARAAGARIATGERVASLEQSAGRIVGVRLLDGTRIEAERVVLAAGAWAHGLGAAAGSRIALEATRRHLAVAFLPGPARPDAPILWDLATGFYARPERGGWLVCLCDRSAVSDVEAPVEVPEVLVALRESVSRYLGGAPERVEPWAGLRTMTADDEFAIGPDSDLPGLFWVAGLGGAGMGAGYAAGRLAAELLSEREHPLAEAVDPGRLSRLAVD